MKPLFVVLGMILLAIGAVGAKVAAIGVMWGMIALSVAVLRSELVRYAVIGAGVVGTIVMGFVVRTVRDADRGE